SSLEPIERAHAVDDIVDVVVRQRGVHRQQQGFGIQLLGTRQPHALEAERWVLMYGPAAELNDRPYALFGEKGFELVAPLRLDLVILVHVEVVFGSIRAGRKAQSLDISEPLLIAPRNRPAALEV